MRASAERYSTRFNSFDDLVSTREAALARIEQKHGIDLTRPPGSGAKDEFTEFTEHGRAIDDGYVGVGSRQGVPGQFNAAGKPVKAFAQTEAISGVTRTQTTVRWNGDVGRWEVKQHFPVAGGWDQQAQAYTRPLP